MMLRLAVLALMCGLVIGTPLRLRSERQHPTYWANRAFEDYDLPKNILPSHYEIHLIPYLPPAPAGQTNFTFDGTVIITFDVAVATKNIQLHAFDVEIVSAKVTDIDGITDLAIEGAPYLTTDNRRDFLFINMTNDLPVAVGYKLEVVYKGKLNTNLEGFYRSSYIDGTGATKWMGVTQFEQTGARRAFPCFDQPEFKAKFTLQIAHAPGYNVLCNMPLESDTEDVPNLPDWKWTKFPVTDVKMPTYLVAFTVSEFTSVTLPSDETYKVWARPELAYQGEYAIGISPRVVNFMETFTGHDYSMPKIDQIAIPDFSAGAMENWGLITYRESSLLFEEGVSSSRNRQGIEATVTHELAHQWFGNLVTTKWWDNIWLNEGFATYFESFALNEVETEWQMESQFVHQDMHGVMVPDGLPTTHPLQIAEVDTPESSSAAFDTISYSKGGCIVRFMVNLMGEDAFKIGINTYLTNRGYDVAVPDDLWSALTPSVPEGTLPMGTDFKTVMDTWLTNAGYPVVTVTRKYDEQRGATFSQARFLTHREEGVEYNEKWYIPLTMSTKQSPAFTNYQILSWLGPSGDVAMVGLAAAENEWIIVNNKQIGYYRVNYDTENWKLLINALHTQKDDIHMINRGQLMDDSLALARAGLLDYTIALDTTNYLIHEAEYHPWAVALSALGYLSDRLITQSDTRGPLNDYMNMLLSPAYDIVNGFTVTEDDSHVMRYKRTLILDWACEQGMSKCTDEASSLFEQWMAEEDPDNNNPIEPDLKSVVYCTALRLGGRDEYNFLFERYEAASQKVSEISTIITALGCASDGAILKEYLDESITDGGRIRTQDARSVHSAVYGNYLGVQVALDFIIENYERCITVYGSAYNVGRSFTGVAGKCNTQAQRDQLNTLYTESETTMDPELRPIVGDSVKIVDENIAWLTHHKDHVTSYFKSKVTTSSATLNSFSPIMLLITITLSMFISKF